MKYIALIFSLLASQIGLGQQTILYRDGEKDFAALVKEYDQGLFGRCIQTASGFIDKYHEPAFESLIARARLYKLKASVRMEKPGVLDEVLAFAEKYSPSPLAEEALLMVGEFAYEEGRYEEAIETFRKIDVRHLDAEARNLLNFKLGYCLFVTRNFQEAVSILQNVKEVRDKFYFPANYYYGMGQYFLGNYTEAIQSFERVGTSSYFKDYIPYYITQIHFSTKNFNEVIGYGNHALTSQTVQNKPEIHQLVGQAYFESGKYEEAIPHLTEVENQPGKLRTDDFYQLGMAYYYTQRYNEAIEPLLQIRNESGIKAQYANYYLAQCYLKTGDKASARNAFLLATKNNSIPELTNESLFHYGRLAAENGEDFDAVRSLNAIPESSSFYNDAATTILDILVRTQDYQLAIQELDSMGTLSPALRKAYQKVCLYRSEQFLQDGNIEQADLTLDKSLLYKEDIDTEIRAYFWKGEIAFRKGLYTQSIVQYEKYFALHPKSRSLPPSQSIAAAKYNQGYNELRRLNYSVAQTLFEESIALIEKNYADQSNLLTKQILPDAVLRAGDCAYKRNQYDKAISFFDKSVNKSYPGIDYARFQKAMIRGLQGKTNEKIKQLESLAKDLPESLWADDALFQTGVTYQEEEQYAKAKENFDRLLEVYGRKSTLRVPTLLQLGLLHYNQGKYEQAIVYYKKVFEYQPDAEASREAINAIQEIYVTELQQPDAYFKFAESIPGFAISVSEKDSIQFKAAENLYHSGDYAKAESALSSYITVYPKSPFSTRAKYLRAESRSLLKQYAKALEGYSEVIESGTGPYYATSLFKAALIAHKDQHDSNKAYEYYQTYIPIAENPEKQLEAQAGALECAFKLGIAKEVYPLADKVINNPRSTPTMVAAAQYYTGMLAFQQQDLDKALPAFNSVIRLQSGDQAAEARYYVANIYAQRKESVLATKMAEEAAKANVGYPVWVAKSLLLLADLKYEANELLDARAILEAILENFSEDNEITSAAEVRLLKVKGEEERQSRVKPDTTDVLEMQTIPKQD